MIWRRDLRNCAEQSHVFSCRLERGFGTCTVVHTQSMRKQHSFIFKMAAALSVLQIPRVFFRGSCYKSPKEIQSLHPGLKIGSNFCGNHPPPPPPGWPLISALTTKVTKKLAQTKEDFSRNLPKIAPSSVKPLSHIHRRNPKQAVHTATKAKEAEKKAEQDSYSVAVRENETTRNRDNCARGPTGPPLQNAIGEYVWLSTQKISNFLGMVSHRNTNQD